MKDPIKHWLQAHPYKSVVRFLKTPKDILAAEKCFGVPKDGKDHYSGWAWDGTHPKDGWHCCFMYVKPRKSCRSGAEHLRTIVHECSHVCLMIFQHHGMRPEETSGEAFSHLLDWLVNEACRFYGVRVA
jgi:hypothetical protein